MPNILVVDDDMGVLRLMRTALEASGHTVLPAFGGQHALKLLKIHDPDLVLTDIRMPSVDGISFFRQARQQWPGLPFLAMSGQAVEEEMLAEGFDGFVEKPCMLTALMQAIERVLKRRKRNRPPEHHLQEANKTYHSDTPKVIAFPLPAQGKSGREVQ